MKAQFVFENIKFERGKDPKAAMDIGVEAKVRKALVQEWLKRAGSNLDNFDWSYERRDLEGYEAYIICRKEFDMNDKLVPEYYGLVPGLTITNGSYPTPDKAYQGIKEKMMARHLGL